jgi:hypothetical protein
MATHTGPFPPASPNPGDIWQRPDGSEQVWDGDHWLPVGGGGPGPGGGNLPVGGNADDHLVKLSATDFDAGWKPPDFGQSFEFVQTTPDDEWAITHNLGQRIVGVTVVDQLGNLVIPSITYVSTSLVRLNFANDKEGTAIIRR